jgi:pimeloyl-ACP methyl ester carboxylesterase
MTLSHDVAGDGPALVLLHAGVCDRRMWDPQWAALIDAGYRVVRCDLRGFGRSPAADRPYNDADDVAGLLSALGVSRAALVGSSYGGRVALELTARRPGLVTALALLCSASPDHVPGDALRSFAEREDTLLGAGDIDGAAELNVETFVGPQAGEAVREQVRRMQRHAFAVQLAAEEVERIRMEVDLSSIKAPCLVVSGGQDLPDFREIAARLTERLADARHHELPWAGHLPGLERPDVVTDLLTEFLRETLATG